MDARPGTPHDVTGAAVLYRLYDIGWEVDLDRALDRLRARAPERVRPVGGEAAALQIPNPPVTVLLGTEHLVLAGGPRDIEVAVEVSARIFDFGVVSLRVRVPVPAGMAWAEFSAFGRALHDDPALPGVFEAHRRLLVERIAPAIERPALAPVTEEYIVFRLGPLHAADGTPVPPQGLGDADVVPLLLGETRPLSEAARRELLPHRFSYYADDLAILTWDNALVVEPAGDDAVSFILEFANAQLLELRYYDDRLDAELRQVLGRVGQPRSAWRRVFTRRYGDLLGELQRLVADATELTERVENALKVTDDVYLARVYAAALELFRGRAWRAGIDRKLAILRETYAMLNAEAQAARSEVLELAIVGLIVAEIVLALAR